MRARFLCWLGYHRYQQVSEVRGEEPHLTSWWNTVCLRCGYTSWFNYPPSTIWCRPRTTEPGTGDSEKACPALPGSDETGEA